MSITSCFTNDYIVFCKCIVYRSDRFSIDLRNIVTHTDAFIVPQFKNRFESIFESIGKILTNLIFGADYKIFKGTGFGLIDDSFVEKGEQLLISGIVTAKDRF